MIKKEMETLQCYRKGNRIFRGFESNYNIIKYLFPKHTPKVKESHTIGQDCDNIIITYETINHFSFHSIITHIMNT
jgi:hypothetical protein